MKKKKVLRTTLVACWCKKKKTLSDASHATISTSAPTERQKLPKSQEGEKEDKKGEKEAVKGSGGGGALELVFFFLLWRSVRRNRRTLLPLFPQIQRRFPKLAPAARLRWYGFLPCEFARVLVSQFHLYLFCSDKFR